MPAEPFDHTQGARAGVTGVRFDVTLDSSSMSVRAALARLRAALGALAIGTDAAGSIELVLAEVLNNIGEHAYRGMDLGCIELSMRADDEMLHFETRDTGLPMPSGRIPLGRGASLDCPIESLPEGGFGWRMIRDLTADLCYFRDGNCNCLSFRMRRDARPVG